MGAICGCCKPRPSAPVRQLIHIGGRGDKVQVSEGLETDVISGSGSALADCRIEQDAAYWEVTLSKLPAESDFRIGIAQKDVDLESMITVAPSGDPSIETQAAQKKEDDFDPSAPSVIGASTKDKHAWAIGAKLGFAEGDVIGVAFTMANLPNLRFLKNGEAISSATVMKIHGVVQPVFSVSGGAELSVGFDEDGFKHPVPSGFTELIKGRGIM
mmetsp:Transcript_12305/g.28815  ORF Transcript_12305/g.28815 Transcript_12305/m.28815 type:complete len:214 (-) Transcript_12305:38-679(-)